MGIDAQIFESNLDLAVLGEAGPYDLDNWYGF